MKELTAMTRWPTMQDLLDPRGRVSRRGLLMVAALLLAADVVLVGLLAATDASFTGPGALAFKVLSVWVATVAVARRLHDLDLSAWWIAKGLAALIAWSIAVSCALLVKFDAADAVDPGHVAFWLNVGVTSAPVLVALGWLHVARGTSGPNRYGPEPDARGVPSPPPVDVIGNASHACPPCERGATAIGPR